MSWMMDLLLTQEDEKVSKEAKEFKALLEAILLLRGEDLLTEKQAAQAKRRLSKLLSKAIIEKGDPVCGTPLFEDVEHIALDESRRREDRCEDPAD